MSLPSILLPMLLMSIVLPNVALSAKYLGCFRDKSKDQRDLPKLAFKDNHLTNERCRRECARLGYRYSATQYSKECFCGSKYGSYGRASNCNKRCSGMKAEICGGNWANSVYETGHAGSSRTCKDISCPNGKQCEMVTVKCIRAPCPAMPTCVFPTNCPTGSKSYGTKCYRFVSSKKSWYSARATCKLLQGKLATINSEAENNFVYSLLGGQKAWIGLNDLLRERYYSWADTSGSVKYKKWYRGEPNNARRGRLDEDCVHIYGSGSAARYWNDMWCTDSLAFVCELPRITVKRPTSSGKYNLIGCYRDSLIRDLPVLGLAHYGHLTIDKCGQKCSSKGFAYFGLQYSRFCFCGAKYGKYGKANNCNMQCSGDRNAKCGGGWANSVYSIGSAKPAPEPPGVCKAWGDPHFLPYDGGVIHFMGTCSYLLSGTCKSTSLTHFEVIVKNEHRGKNWRVSYIRIVQVHVDNHVISLIKGKGIMVDGKMVNPPINYIKDIKIFLSGNNMVVQFANGVIVRYDGGYTATVTSPAAYKGLLCGMCGNFDGNSPNDWRTKEGKQESGRAAGNAIGNSWQLAQDVLGDKKCSIATGSDLPKCPAGKRPMAEGDDYCGAITSAVSKFSACVKKIGAVQAKEMFISCVTDVCTADDDKRKKVACTSLEALAKRCINLGFNIDWRQSVGCEIKCGENKAYGKSISACPRTCANPNAHTECKLPNIEGCQCKPGYVLSGMKCVPSSQCGCVDADGIYHMKGDTWLSNNCMIEYTCVSFSNIKHKNLQPCHSHGECVLYDGKRQCRCRQPYLGDGVNTCDVPATPPPPATEPPEPECNGKKIDLAFVIDESSSINEKQFEQIKDFAKFIVEKMPVGPETTHVATITFSNSPKKHYTFRNTQTKESVTGAINKVKQRGGGTYTHSAIEMMINTMSTSEGGRYDAAPVAILITDGKSEKCELTKIAATAAHAAGITTIAVGIGKYDKDEIAAIATDPDDDHRFEVKDFDKLTYIVNTISRIACSGTPRPTVAPTATAATSKPSVVPKLCDGIPQSERHNGKFMVDPDGPNTGADRFMVECDFSGARPMTILHNKQETKQCISDCKERDQGCFVQTIQYDASPYQTNQFVKNAQHCEQTLRYDCCNSALDYRTHNNNGPNSWWVNGKGEKMNYWPGGPESGGCACAKTNSCAKKSEKCNCDANDNVWRFDEGTITDKSQLPIAELAIGDINKPGKEVCVTLGPLKCY